MNLIGLMSIVILIITVLTLIFGIIAYFMYKIRDKRNSRRPPTSYEDKCNELGIDFIFFDK